MEQAAGETAQGEDSGFADYVEELIDVGYVDDTTPVAELLRQVAARGEVSMTSVQRAAYARDFLAVFGRRKCVGCGSVVKWNEMIDALVNGGLCSGCERPAADA